MVSRQSGAVSTLYQIFLAAPLDDEPIHDQQQWDVLTAEPGGVDYLEIDAGGVPAMWAVPKVSEPGHVLLCIHGGGFVSGSMYTGER